MYVFAGNNGSGKSSFRNIVGEKLGIRVNIDPDSLARKYNTHKDMRAGREALLLVEQGGHDIPTATVLRRADRTVNNLIQIMNTVDQIYLIDNTTLNAHIVAKINMEDKKVDVISEEVPQWAVPIIKNINMLHEKD